MRMIDKKLLHKSSLFKAMSPNMLDDIAAACEPLAVPAGEYVYKRDTRITSYNVCYTKLLRVTNYQKLILLKQVI